MTINILTDYKEMSEFLFLFKVFYAFMLSGAIDLARFEEILS